MKDLQDNGYINIYDLKKGDGFYFQGDIQQETYYFRKCDGAYAQVVEKKKDIDNMDKWAFVSCGSIVMKIDE